LGRIVRQRAFEVTAGLTQRRLVHFRHIAQELVGEIASKHGADLRRFACAA
jgi:hypothetical protein